jgi:hypothetical protein
MDKSASKEAVKQHSPDLQQLLDQGAQHVPSLLRTQGAAAQSVGLILLAYAYAGYTGDLGLVTQALASNLEGCLQGAKPQQCSNIVWALGKLWELRQHECQQAELQLISYRQQVFSYCLSELNKQLGEASPQAISNAVYGCALAGHAEGVPQLLDSVCQQPQVMARALPQAWSNTIWAGAKLGCVEQVSLLVKGLADQPQAMARAKPQEWSNILWAAATMCEAAAGQEHHWGLAKQLLHSGTALLAALLQQPQVVARMNSQHCSISLWAAATLYQSAVDISSSAPAKDKLQKGGHWLFQACACNPAALQGANSQNWSNTLWAAAVFCCYDQRLFSQGAAALAAIPPAEVKPQEISKALYACALCAHGDDNVKQLICQVEEYDLTAFNEQELTNTLYAWAVLSHLVSTAGASQQQQCLCSSATKSLFRAAARRDVNSYTQGGLRQLYVAHLYCQHLRIPGLPAGAVVEAARAVGWFGGKATISAGQRKVCSILQQLGYNTQLEMRSPDGVMSADVGVTALPDGRPCSIAVEFDGPHHFVADYSSSNSSSSNRETVDRLDGPTRLRNALLHARFPDGLVCIPWKEWVAAKQAGEQEEYLRAALAAVLSTKVSVAFMIRCNVPQTKVYTVEA